MLFSFKISFLTVGKKPPFFSLKPISVSFWICLPVEPSCRSPQIISGSWHLSASANTADHSSSLSSLRLETYHDATPCENIAVCTAYTFKIQIGTGLSFNHTLRYTTLFGRQLSNRIGIYPKSFRINVTLIRLLWCFRWLNDMGVIIS